MGRTSRILLKLAPEDRPTKSRAEIPSLTEVVQNRFRLRTGHDRGQRGDVRLLYSLHAAKVFEQAARGVLANSRNLSQLSRAVAHLAALAMESHSETMCLVADQLHQVQYRCVMIEDYGFVLLSGDADALFSLCNRGQS